MTLSPLVAPVCSVVQAAALATVARWQDTVLVATRADPRVSEAVWLALIAAVVVPVVGHTMTYLQARATHKMVNSQNTENLKNILALQNEIRRLNLPGEEKTPKTRTNLAPITIGVGGELTLTGPPPSVPPIPAPGSASAEDANNDEPKDTV